MRYEYPLDWAIEQDIEILDPDGWRFGCGDLKPRSFYDFITESEFNDRANASTQQQSKKVS